MAEAAAVPARSLFESVPAVRQVALLVGVSAAIAAAQKLGANKAIFVDYYTSFDIMPGDSFVGYGGAVWAA